jgi:hypothetical protein
METAQLILQLAGHQELLKAELLQIDSDIKGLSELSKRYPEKKELFLTPQGDLRRVKKEKEAEEKEIRLHLQCYDLHRPTGEKILAKVIKAEKQRSLAASTSTTAPTSSAISPGAAAAGTGFPGTSNGFLSRLPPSATQNSASGLHQQTVAPRQHMNPMALSSISSSASTSAVRPVAATGIAAATTDSTRRLAASAADTTAHRGQVRQEQQQHLHPRDVLTPAATDNRPLYGLYTKPGAVVQQPSSANLRDNQQRPTSSQCSTSRAATAGRNATAANNGSFDTRDDASSAGGVPDDSEYLGNNDRYVQEQQQHYRNSIQQQQQQRPTQAVRSGGHRLGTTTAFSAGQQHRNEVHDANQPQAYRHYDHDDFSAASSSENVHVDRRFGGGVGSTSMDDSSV